MPDIPIDAEFGIGLENNTSFERLSLVYNTLLNRLYFVHQNDKI